MGKEDKATGRVGERLAYEECWRFPLVYNKLCWFFVTELLLYFMTNFNVYDFKHISNCNFAIRFLIFDTLLSRKGTGRLRLFVHIELHTKITVGIVNNNYLLFKFQIGYKSSGFHGYPLKLPGDTIERFANHHLIMDTKKAGASPRT